VYLDTLVAGLYHHRRLVSGFVYICHCSAEVPERGEGGGLGPGAVLAEEAEGEG